MGSIIFTTLRLLTIAVGYWFTCMVVACESSPKISKQTLVVGKQAFIIDLVPLKSPIATQFIIYSSGWLQVCHYQPTRMLVQDCRQGTQVDQDVIAVLRATVEENNSTMVGQERPILIEDDQLRLLYWDTPEVNIVINKPLSLITPELYHVLGILEETPVDNPLVDAGTYYIRCVPVPETQLTSIKRRGTYELNKLNTLPALAKSAIKDALFPVGAFRGIDSEKAKAIKAVTNKEQVFTTYGGGIFGCELYASQID